MSTTAFEIPPQLVSLKPVKRSFTVLNSGPKEKAPMFIGNILTIPPVHALLHGRDERSQPVLLSDTDADGDPIPGSRVIEDQYVLLPDLNEDVLVFDAVRAVCHILGLQPGSDQNATVATSAFALNGLSIIPRHAPKAQWKRIAQEGEKRAFVAEVVRARTLLKAVDETNLIRKKHNMESVVDDQAEYDRAKFVIEQYNVMMKATVQMAPHQADALDADIEFMAFAKARVLEVATKAAEGKSIDRTALAEELLKDPVILAKLRKAHGYRIRKVGSMPKSRKELDDDARVKAAGEAKAAAVASFNEDEQDEQDEPIAPDPEPLPDEPEPGEPFNPDDPEPDKVS